MHGDEARDDRLRRLLAAVVLPVELAVVLQLLQRLLPGLLGDDEDADAEPGHDLRRLRRDGGRIGAPAEGLEGPGADVRRRLAEMLAVALHGARLQRAHHRLGIFDEALAALAHFEAEAVELHPPEAAPHAEDHPPVRQVVEQRDLLRDPDRLVPGQHDHHGAEAGARRPPGHVGQELGHARAHGVVGEMVLGRPDAVEAHRLRRLGQRHLLPPDLAVRQLPVRVLEKAAQADMHGTGALLGSQRAVFAAGRTCPGPGLRVKSRAETAALGRYRNVRMKPSPISTNSRRGEGVSANAHSCSINDIADDTLRAAIVSRQDSFIRLSRL